MSGPILQHRGGRRQLIAGRRAQVARAGGSFSPEQLDGLYAWYDASQIEGLAELDALSSWTDLSGNAHHAAQGTASKQPKYDLEVGDPCVRFDGAQTSLVAASWVAQAARTIFCVPKSLASAGRAAYGVGNSNGGLTTDATEWRWANPITPRFGGSIGVKSVVAVTVESAASLTGYVNGGAGVNLNPEDTVWTGANFELGSRGGANYYNGWLYEVIVYNVVLTAQQRGQVEDYLMEKWAV